MLQSKSREINRKLAENSGCVEQKWKSFCTFQWHRDLDSLLEVCDTGLTKRYLPDIPNCCSEANISIEFRTSSGNSILHHRQWVDEIQLHQIQISDVKFYICKFKQKLLLFTSVQNYVTLFLGNKLRLHITCDLTSLSLVKKKNINFLLSGFLH